jgi:prolycopene isomerase
MTEMPARYPNMLAAMSQSWGDYIGQYTSDQQLQAVLGTLLGYYGLPPSKLNAATFILPWVSYHFFGAFYPEGGSMAMSHAIEATIKKHGGEVRYRQTVNRIEVQDGKAVAVVTEDGLRVEADVIISNANAPDTMLRFVGRDHLPPKYMQQVEAALAKPAVSNVVVYLGLERDLLAEGWEHHEVFTFTGYDAEADYAAVKDGRFEDAGVCISHYNHADPTCAPEGCSVISLITLAHWDYADQWGTRGNLENYRQNPHYLELKEDAGDQLISQAEKFIPGLREAIKYKEIATPLTNYRYTRNPGGSIYGSEQSVDNMYINRLNAKTPIPNLFLTGAWVFGGGMSAAMLSGRNGAQMAGAFLDGKLPSNPMQPEQNRGDRKRPSPPKPQNKESTMGPYKLNCHDTIAGMPLVFNPEVAGGLTVDIQFNVSGDEPGDYYLHIENDACEFIEGASDNASLTINTPSDVWLAISRGELDGQMAFMQQKYKVQGDFGLLMKMGKMFKSG